MTGSQTVTMKAMLTAGIALVPTETPEETA
jgi:hypothetical protein